MVNTLSRIIIALAACLLQGGCAVYRFSSPDHPSKIPLETVVAASHPGENGLPTRFHIAKVRGTVFGGSAGRVSFSPEALNARLSSLWPKLFDAGETSGGSIPLTVELGGNLSLYSLGALAGDIGVEIALMLVGILHMESEGEVTAKVLINNAVWSGVAKAEGQCNTAVHVLMLPIPYLLPPYQSDWPSDSHLGGLGYTNAKRTQQIAEDLASVAILKAVAGLTSQQIATMRSKVLLNEKQLASRKRLDEGAKTLAAVEASGDAVSFVETRHTFQFDSSLAARDIPEILEQRYDEQTRRGFVRADMKGCDPERAYRYLTQRLIPAICETKNVVLDVSSPPPSHALFKTLGERKEADSDVLAIEFEAIQ